MKYIQWQWQSHFSHYSVKTWNSTSHNEEVLRRCGKASLFSNCSRACTRVWKHTIRISGESKLHSSVLCGSPYSVLPPLSSVALKKPITCSAGHVKYWLFEACKKWVVWCGHSYFCAVATLKIFSKYWANNHWPKKFTVNPNKNC